MTLLLLEHLEARHLLTGGLWLAMFDGISPATTLDDQASEGESLLQASGLVNPEIHVVRALDFNGTFVLQTSLDATQEDVNAELNAAVPGFLSVQDYNGNPDASADDKAGDEGDDEGGGDLINWDTYNELYGPFDYDTFAAREQSGEVEDGSGSVASSEQSDALTNNNTGSTTTSGFTQSETTVVALGSTVIVGYNDSGSATGGANKFTGFSRSTDGGSTFTDGGTLPTNTNGDAGDPVLAMNTTTGRIFFATLQFSGSGEEVFHSDDGGLTWSAPVQGAPGKTNGLQDKEWIAVDNFGGPGNGNVYLVERDFGTGSGIYFYRSTDGGGNSFGPNGGTLIASGSTGNVQGAYVTVGPDHAVYVFYYDNSTATQFIKVRKSTDQGQTFGSPVTIATITAPLGNGDVNLTGTVQGTLTPSYFRSSAFPHAAVNPVTGNLYVTFNNKGSGSDKSDVFFAQSTNGGATWSSPIRVNDDVTITDEWQPTIAVTPDGANLGIFYSSRQEDPLSNNLFKYYGRIASISGSTVTFSPSFPVSDTASLPEFGRDSLVNSVYMSDYNTAYGTPGAFSVSWSDSRTDLSGGIPRKDPNVFYKTVSLLNVTSTTPVAGSSTSTQPTSFTVNLTSPVDPASLQASDFQVNGTPATSVSYVLGSTTISFSYAVSPVTTQGPQTMHINAGAFSRAGDGSGVSRFDGTFYYDTTALHVVSTVPAFPNGVLTVPTATLDVNFNEAVSPASVVPTDLILSGIGGTFVSAVTFLNGFTTARFTITGLTSEGTLSATIVAGTINDSFGNPSTNSFATTYQVDAVTTAYPTPLASKLPSGSLVYDPAATGVVNFAGDTDNFTLALDPGQSVTVLVTPAAGTLYGAVGNGGINAGSLLTINPTIGSGSFVADPVNPGGLSGLVFDPSTGLLLGSTIRNTDGTSTLVTLDPATGALLSSIGTITDGVGGPAMSIGDLALQPNTNTLYAVRSNADGTAQGGKLYTVNKATGAATLVGSTGSAAGGGIAFAPDGSLYQTAFNSGGDFPSLNRLDPATAARLSTVALSRYYDGLAIRPSDGVLFAATGGTNDQIYTINATTGAQVLIGSTAAGSTSDLAFVGLQPSVTLKDPSNAVIGTATAAGVTQKALLETIPATASGTYTMVISGAGATTGGYTVQVVLNAANESEGNLLGATNDTRATAENIASSFTNLQQNVSSSQRGAVLGGNPLILNAFSTSDFEAGQQGYVINNNIRGTGASAGLWHLSTRRASDAGHSPITDFYYGSESTGTYSTGAANAGTITSAPFVVPSGASLSFNYVLQTENLSGFDIARVQVSSNSFSTSTDLLTNLTGGGLVNTASWIASASSSLAAFAGQTVQVRFFFDTIDSVSNAFEGWYVDDVQISTAVPWSDYYAFTATENDKVSVAMKQLTGTGVSVFIENSAGTVLATGTPGATNYDAGINSLLITAPGTNTYYLRVSGAVAATYNAVVTENAAFDTEPNDSILTPQNIDGTRAVLGYVSTSALYGANRAGQLFTVNQATGAGTLVGTLPFNTTEIEFDNLSRRAFAQANDGSSFGREFDISTAAGIGSNISNGASFTGLEWVGSTLYGAAFLGPGTNSTLRTLNPFTGVSTTIGATGFGPIAGLAYDTTTSTMYGITGGAAGTLLTVNLVTGAATTVGATGFRAGSLEFGPDGNLYGGGTGSDEAKIFRINKATGASTLVGLTNIGTTGTRDVTGLTTVFNDTDDWYSIDVTSLATFRLETSTPADGANQFVNTLNPHIELYDPSNNLVPVATGVALADGRNESILYTPTVTGAFRVHVTAEGGTAGEYALSRSSVLYWDADGVTTGNNISTGAGLGGTGTWDTSSGKWFDGVNEVAWTNSNNTAIFEGATGTVTLGMPITAGALNFNTTGYLLTSIPSNSLTLAGVAQVNVGSAALSDTISSQLSGSSGLTTTGAGTLVLSNSTNNYTGPTAINAGTVQLGASGAIPSTSAVSLANVAGATLNLNSLSDAIGSLAGGGATGGNVSLGTATLTTGADSSSTTYAGAISGTGGLTKIGTGTLTLTSAVSSYSGQTNVSAGTLSATTLASSGTNSSIGTGTASSTILIGSASAATLSYTGSASVTSNRPITVNGAGGGTIQATASGFILTLSGGVNNSGNPLVFNTNTGNITESGVVSGAGSVTKNGTATLTLSNTTNTFSGQLIVNAGVLSFGSAGGSSLGTGAVNPTILLGSSSAATLFYTGGTGTTARLISINGAGGGTIQASAAGTLTLTGGISTNGNPLSFTASLGNITETGAITGGGAVIKNGSSIVTLGSPANSYSGSTTINAGTLQAGATNAIPAASAVSLTSSSATLNLNNLNDTVGSLSNSNLAGLNITNSGTGYTSTPTLVFTGGGGSGAAGTGLLGAVSVNVTNGGGGYAAAPTISFSSPSISSGVTASGTTTFTSGVVTAVNVVGAGSGYSAPPNVVISASAGGTTATGTANLKVVSVTIANGGVGYSSAPNVTFSAPPAGGTTATGTANISGGTVTSITINTAGTGYTSIPTITLSGGGFTVPATATAVMGLNAVTLTSGGSGYSGAPLVIFSSPSTATGFVTISAGVVTGIIIVNRGSGYTSVPTITFNNGGFGGTGAVATPVLGVVGASMTNTGVGYTSPPSVDLTGGAGTGFAATAPLTTANVTLGSGTLTTGGNNTSTAFNGTISGSGNFSKSGGGTFTLSSSPSSYSGATNVNAGTLLVMSSNATSPTTVNSGGTLGGTGTTDGITVNSGGALAPGASPGILNTGSIAMSAGAVFRAELNGSIAGSGYDQANVTGTVALNGATLNASVGFNSAVGDAFTIINNDLDDAVTGTFDGLPEGAIFVPSGAPAGQFYTITYVGGTGNDVVITHLLSDTQPLVVSPAASQQAAEGILTPFDVGSFTDAALGPWKVTINWGDSGPSTSFSTTSTGPLGTQNHSYIDEGAKTVTVTVSDSASRSSTASFTINVLDTAPLVAADHAAVSAAENSAATNSGTFSDYDDAVTITASRGSVSQTGSLTGSWSWSGTGDDDHPYSVSITATNADGTTATTSFNVSFTDVAPTVSADLAAVSAAENASAINTGAFSDYDDAVIISTSSGTVTQIGAQSGSWAWSGTGDEESPYSVTITATNADGSTATTTFNVSFIDATPIVSADLAAASAAENTAATNTGAFSDYDDAIAISASSGTVTQSGTQIGTWSWSGTGDDDSPYSVTITATNADGSKATTTFNVSFTDVAPTVSADLAAVSAAENAAATNTGAFSDFDDAVIISTSTGTVTQIGAPGGTWAWSGAGDEETPYSVTITATNADGSIATTTFLVSFSDVPPVVSPASTNVTFNEGQTATNSGAFSDYDDAVTITASEGDVQQSASHAGTWSWSNPYPDNGDQTITITATNADGSHAETSFTVHVNNVAPTATDNTYTTNQATAKSGNVILDTFPAGADSDPAGANDPLTISSFTSPSNGTLVLNLDGSFIYTPASTFTGDDSFTYKINDGDGGQATATVTIHVTAAAPGSILTIPDSSLGGTALLITGTSLSDTIVVEPGGATSMLKVTRNGLSTTVPMPSGRIIVVGGAGDDNIQIAGAVANPVWLYGEAGNDRLNAGNGGGLLIGGDGNDQLLGGNGRDVLIGGEGADSLGGNGSDDILVAGLTLFDSRATAGHEQFWSNVLKEWTSGNDFATRVQNLRNGSGGNAHNAGSLLTPNVREDLSADAVDLLNGAAGDDWLILLLTEDKIAGQSEATN